MGWVSFPERSVGSTAFYQIVGTETPFLALASNELRPPQKVGSWPALENGKAESDHFLPFALVYMTSYLGPVLLSADRSPFFSKPIFQSCPSFDIPRKSTH